MKKQNKLPHSVSNLRVYRSGEYSAKVYSARKIMTAIKKAQASKFRVPMYLQFMEWACSNGFNVRLYEAKRTESKYVFIQDKTHKYKIRFSTHPIPRHKDKLSDCDFLVGNGNGGKYISTKMLKQLLSI
jgi:hypothetical protein